MKLSWGDFIALVLPGAVVLLSLQQFIPTINKLLQDPNAIKVPGGLFLLAAAALAGGILEAIRRVVIDELLVNRLRSFRPVPNDAERSMFYYLTSQTITVFNNAVDSSYKYYSFYANLALALLLTVLARWVTKPRWFDLVLIAAAAGLFGAAFIQYRYFKTFVRDFTARQKTEIEKGEQDHARKLASTQHATLDNSAPDSLGTALPKGDAVPSRSTSRKD